MLFIALLVMVALSLAGIALIRSADTATIVAGNLAFKQAAAAAVDRSIEQAVQALFDPQLDPTTSTPVITDKNDRPSRPELFRLVRLQRQRHPGDPGRAPIGQRVDRRRPRHDLVPDDAAGNKSYYVIERMCANPGAAVGSNCNLSSAALGADAGTQHYEALSAPATPFTASRSASKARAIRWPMRRRSSSSRARRHRIPGAAP